MMFIVYFAFFVIIQLHAARSSSATEPVCSKFSYEEKLLEKMIRTEIKVESMQSEIRKTEETVLNTLVEIKKTALDIQDKFEGFSNDLTTKIVAQMKEMQSKEEQIANQFEELTNNITMKMENERDILAKLKEPIIQPSVAFHVHNVKDLVLDTTNEVLVFESIITNERSGYDQSTGIFTAPVDGVYYFNVHVCSANSKFSPIGLVLDGTFVARSINYDTDTYTCSSVSAIVRMKSGGRVWVASTAEQISNQFEELTNNITENERDILAKLRESIIQPSIAFHVHNAKDLILNTNNEVLVFESIITNEGSGYDKSTGIFTAPIEGAYFFTVHVCTANDKYSPIGLVFDSLFVARSINHDKDYFTCGSVSAIVKMKSGGQVSVASTQGSRDYVLNAEDMYGMNTFSGVLLSKHK